MRSLDTKLQCTDSHRLGETFSLSRSLPERAETEIEQVKRIANCQCFLGTFPKGPRSIMPTQTGTCPLRFLSQEFDAISKKN